MYILSSITRHTLLLLILLLIVNFSSERLEAQIQISRFVSFGDCNLSTSSLQTEQGFLSQTLFAMEVNRALGNVTPPRGEEEEEELSDFPNRDQAWNFKFSELIDVYRWSPSSSIRLQCSQELLANERNDIHFNPRAAVWEEELICQGLFSISRSSTSISVFHRCKHDIDNSDQEEDDKVVPAYVKKRTIILGGLALIQTLDQEVVFDRSSPWKFQAEGRLETYFYTEDYRYPFVSFGHSWSSLRGSAMIRTRLDYRIGKSVSLGIRAHLAEAYFGSELQRTASFGNVTRVEGCCTLKGTAADLTVAIVNERLFDDVARISADATNTWSLTLRISPQQAW